MSISARYGYLLVASLSVATVSHGNGPRGRAEFNKLKELRVAGQKAEREIFAPLNKPVATVMVSAATAPQDEAHASVSAPAVVTQTPSASFSPAPEVLSQRTSADLTSAATPTVAGPEPVITPTPSATRDSIALTTPPSSPTHPEKISTPVRRRPTVTYADVLTEKQKTVLNERAKVLGVTVTDYEKLLSSDEKERMDALVKARTESVASGE